MAEKVDQMDPDEKIVEIAIERLRVFENHPFRVEMDSQMKDLQDSIKKYGIITGLGHLAVVTERREEARLRIISLTAAQRHLTHNRHQANITQIGTARTAEMKHTEALNRIVGIIIAGTPVPALPHLIGAYIHSTERNIGTHEHMTMVVGSDKRIHIVNMVGRNNGCRTHETHH